MNNNHFMVNIKAWYKPSIAKARFLHIKFIFKHLLSLLKILSVCLRNTTVDIFLYIHSIIIISQGGASRGEGEEGGLGGMLPIKVLKSSNRQHLNFGISLPKMGRQWPIPSMACACRESRKHF